VELVRQGAENYLAKPWDDQKLLQQIGLLLQAREARAQVPQNTVGLLYRSKAMATVVATAQKVAPADVSVLITGPNGSGKEKVAELIHAHSARRQRPLLRINAGAIPTELLEAELFGAEAGAYTGIQRSRVGIFESANGGTLFLDEIGNLPAAGQAKLLRVLQTGEFQRLGSPRTLRSDLRLICATNADLPAEIAAGSFRQDLYFRINVIEIRLPPLSERLEDVLLLAHHFKDQYASALEFSGEAKRCLLEHPWPGNVRELQNRLQRACLMAQGSSIEPWDLGLVESLADRTTGRQSDAASPTSRGPNGEGERELLRALLNRHGGVVAQVARELGISRQALYRKMEKCNLVLEKRTNP
jgi:DNA-binding NtrC family response regulator